MTVIGYIIGLGIGIGAPSLFLYLALRSLLADVWNLLFITDLPSRKIPAFVFFLLWSFPVAWGTLSLFGTARIASLFFVLAAIVPALTWLSLNLWAWWRDDGQTRRAALEIAIERAHRRGEPTPIANTKRPWKDYLFDAEVARRRDLYEPPPI